MHLPSLSTYTFEKLYGMHLGLMCVVFTKGYSVLLCKHESFNVQKSWQLCSFLLKPSELVQRNAMLVRGTSNAEVKENNKSAGIMEEASAKTKTNDDYMRGELVSIVSFDFCYLLL